MESEACSLLCLGFSCSVLFVGASVLLHVVAAFHFHGWYGIPLCEYALIH